MYIISIRIKLCVLHNCTCKYTGIYMHFIIIIYAYMHTCT